jgi:hypothetical protein
VDRETRRRLAALHVEYVEAPLNERCPEYGSANRVVAAAWVEPRASTEWVIVLDSDTLVLAEPHLPSGADVAVRPVDTKGSASTGPGDQFERYWQPVAGLQGMSLDRLPFVATTDGEHRVRASYNGGLVVARRSLGLLAAWASLFDRSVAVGLRPWRGSGLNVHASTGPVGTAASEFWGSNQTALSLAMWSLTERVHVYPASYNVPLHLLAERPALLARYAPVDPVHVHYHWLFTEAHAPRALSTLHGLGLDENRLSWLRARLPLSTG